MPAHTVLVIDDDEPIREVVRLTLELEEAGFTVLEASNGLEGLDVLRGSDTPLVVLLDLMMPFMSGMELLHAVAAEPTLAARDAYIIFSAARASSGATLGSSLPGQRLFDLPKPFDLDELVSIVEQAALLLDSTAADRESPAGAPVPGPGTLAPSGTQDTAVGT
jgi:CheY-like chemotaxis protein